MIDWEIVHYAALLGLGDEVCGYYNQVCWCWLLLHFAVRFASLVEATTSIISVATKVLSGQTRVCCQNMSFFVTTRVCSSQWNDVCATYIFCCDKRSVLSWQKWCLWQLPPMIGLRVLQRSCGREECATSFLIPVSSLGIVPSRNVHFWLLWKLCHVDLCRWCVCSFESIPGKNLRFLCGLVG